MAEQIKYENLSAPFSDQVIQDNGLLHRSWQVFFQKIVNLLSPLGQEKSFDIINHQTTWADIAGLSFDKKYVSLAVIDILVQRVTSTTESVSGGSYTVFYKPDAESWVHASDPTLPNIAGVTLNLTPAGQMQYQSSSLGGTQSISRIIWRVRTLAGKHSSYSAMGR